jgi:glutaredoxin
MDDISRRILETFDRVKLSRLAATDLAAAAARVSAPEAAVAAVANLVAGGWLREAAGHYERTELGRLQIAGERELTLLSREGCKLCVEALHQLEPLVSAFGAALRVVDVDTDQTLRARYGLDVPVLFLGSREVARHRIDLHELRSELTRARKGS